MGYVRIDFFDGKTGWKELKEVLASFAPGTEPPDWSSAVALADAEKEKAEAELKKLRAANKKEYEKQQEAARKQAKADEAAGALPA